LLTDGGEVVVWAVVLAVSGLAAWGWRSLRRRKLREDFRASARWQQSDDFKTKHRLDSALSELRELRDALPPSERLRIERRKQALGPPGGNERRKGRPRGRPDQSP
jgi:hypothetical protein